MLRFTFPYMFFISLVALGSGVLNSYGRFAVPALNQTLLNVVMIVAAGVVAPYFPKPGLVLAIGVFVAGRRAARRPVSGAARGSASCRARASTARTRACGASGG